MGGLHACCLVALRHRRHHAHSSLQVALPPPYAHLARARHSRACNAGARNVHTVCIQRACDVMRWAIEVDWEVDWEVDI